MARMKPAQIVLIVLLLTAWGFTQENPPAGQQEPVFRKNVNLVNLFFNVKDKHGALIPGLTQDQFQVLEDGKPQTIKYFSAESNQPRTVSIWVDTSLIMQKMLPETKAIAVDFLHQVLTDKELAFVISLDISVDLLQDLTSDVRGWRAGLEKARINVGGGGGCGVPG